MIKVIDSIDKLREFENEWIRLYNESNDTTPFQEFGYVYSSVKNSSLFSDKLLIITIHNAQLKRCVAIFPLYLNNGILRYINYRHTDFCAPLILEGQSHYNLYKEFCEYISDNNNIKRIVWDNISVSNPIISTLKAKFRYLIASDINYYSDIEIQRSKGDRDFWSSLNYMSSHQKNVLKKEQKRIPEGCVLKIHNKKTGDEYPQKDIISLINVMVESGSRSNEYFSEEMLSFWKDLYEYGTLSIATIYDNDRPVVSNLLFIDQNKNEYISWILLYRDTFWSSAIYIELIKYIYSTHENGILNFARGIYAFKIIKFHPDVKALFSVRISKTRWGHLRNMASVGFHYLKPVIKSFLGR